MADREFKVGEVLETYEDLLALPSGAVFSYEDGHFGVEYVRVVNGFYGTDGDAQGEFVSNQDAQAYFGVTSPYRLDILPEPEITKQQIDEQNSGCGGDCACKQPAEEDAAETIKPKEFVPLFPNDPSDPNRETPRGDVLREAEALITGDRNKTYGPPTENFRNIAELINVRFRHLLKPGERFTGSDVADLMVLVKIARNAADPKRDNFVDIAGYAACGYECLLDESE